MKRDSGGTGLRFVVSVLALAVTLSLTRIAAASKPYPGKIQETLEMSCAPPCTLCHATPEGGGPMAQPFGRAFQATADMVADAPERIPHALDLMEGPVCIYARGETEQAGACDSDQDKVPDIDELRAGTNPNVAGDATFCVRYGCGARVARGSADFDWVALVIAGAAAATLISGARRSRRSG